ncbi:MAG: hypothetical protein Q7W05_13960, partial [Deltaproteobacteria bacterium]|nr:hypothetical protein [Deltaproteobacteria bacterium]
KGNIFFSNDHFRHLRRLHSSAAQTLFRITSFAVHSSLDFYAQRLSFFVSLNTIWNKDCALGDNGDSRFSTALSGSGSFKPPALHVVPDSLPCRQNLWVDCSAPV